MKKLTDEQIREFIAIQEDAAYEEYQSTNDYEVWERESSCAVYFCEVYDTPEYMGDRIDYFCVHADEIDLSSDTEYEDAEKFAIDYVKGALRYENDKVYYDEIRDDLELQGIMEMNVEQELI